MNRVDLHTHSTCSDGTLSPAALVKAAADGGLRIVALTDHDTVSGVAEALAAAERLNAQSPGLITVIPGVEISADHDNVLHILGYFTPGGCTRIGPFLDEMKNERHIRNLRVIGKLNGMGIRITAGEVAALAGREVFGRPHIAAVLIQKGVVASIPSAFNEYLSRGRKAYVKKSSRPAEDCVAAIAGAGGLPVIAHPSQTGLRLSELTELASGLIKHGLFGIEAYYSDHTPAETQNYVNLAGELGLSVTGGSDFHGETKKSIKLGSGKNGGLNVPDGAADAVINALKNID